MYLDTNKTCEEAVATWGEDAQIDVAMEECAELIAALVHFRRKRASRELVSEEIADVIIMTHQLACVFGYDNVNTALHRKMERLYIKLSDTKAREEE